LVKNISLLDYCIIIKIINQEVVWEEKTYSLEEAIEVGIEKLEYEFQKDEISLDKVLNKQVNTKETEQQVEIELIYEVLEKIGSEEKIVF
jgi:hypothetical protein